MTRSIESHTIVWRGITIEVRYEPCWLGSEGEFSTAHLEVRAQMPDRAAIPITETGYRSHFANPGEIEDEGGPVAFVTAWLNEAAQSKGWKEKEDASRQYALF